MTEKIVTKEEVWAAFAETDRKLDRLALGLEELKEQQKETDRIVRAAAATAREVSENSRKLDEQIAATAREVSENSRKVDEQIAETTKTVKAVTLQMGGMANSNGAFAEDYFFNTLGDSREFAGQHYDMVDGNVKRNINGVKDQFDIIMYNGSSVAIIETKYKADLDDIDVLTTRKIRNFRAFFPEYKNHKIYLGISSMSFDDKVIAKARNMGVGILEQKGDTLETDTTYMRPY
ncbi:MAG: hypothetical protein Ta2A_14930 [Treponemataceae bacterium]|nr:MAG: hypothetical protein Ta2A_14930 [Treponemataceae bacterium]